MKMKNILDFKGTKEYYYICQEGTERRKAHNRPHVRVSRLWRNREVKKLLDTIKAKC